MESRETRAAAQPPASETRPAGRPGVCRAECIRRRLGLRRSTLFAVVARRDAAPMKRLGMAATSPWRWAAPRRTVAGGEHSDGLTYTPAALRRRDRFERRCGRESSGARMSREGRGFNHSEGEGTALGRIGSGLLGQTGGYTSSRHHKGRVAPSNSGHKLHRRTCVINIAHRCNISYFGVFWSTI